MTVIMGIVNVTPDSFSDGGRYLDHEAAVTHGLRLRAEGAEVLDVGGESTRPGSERVPVELEQERVVPVVHALAEAGALVSIDTMNASTAAAAIAAGARIVNDVSGGLADPGMLAVVAESRADVVLGHWRGHSDRMYAGAEYRDVVREVVGELRDRLAAAASAGIAPSRVILDPGIGFAKRGGQNWDLLRGLSHLVGVGPRVLIGTSRKRFLADALDGDVTEDRRDLATAVTSVLAAREGAWAVRVHEVRATRDALRVEGAWRGGVS
jgi:dihydropteroate synthase